MLSAPFDTGRFDYELSRRGLDGRSLARGTGLNECVISRIRRGRVKPRPQTLRKIAAYLAAYPVLPGAELVLGEPDKKKAVAVSTSATATGDDGADVDARAEA
jgi:transcriptional regulator with XRE-family HTH domain